MEVQLRLLPRLGRPPLPLPLLQDFLKRRQSPRLLLVALQLCLRNLMPEVRPVSLQDSKR